MPGAQEAGNKLDDFAIAANEKMTGDFQICQCLVIRMCLRIELVGEQLNDACTAEFFRRQADDIVLIRPFIAIR